MPTVRKAILLNDCPIIGRTLPDKHLCRYEHEKTNHRRLGVYEIWQNVFVPQQRGIKPQNNEMMLGIALSSHQRDGEIEH